MCSIGGGDDEFVDVNDPTYQPSSADDDDDDEDEEEDYFLDRIRYVIESVAF